MRVVVAGGGLVGLSFAGLLRLRGVDVEVLERMPPGAYVRRGFMLGHQGFDALDELGVLDDIRGRGRPIAPTPDGSSAAIAVEVGLLLHRLAENVPVHYQHTVTGLLRDESGRIAGVAVEGPEGSSTISADLVVACDGRHSRVREMAGLSAEIAPLAEGKIEWMSPVPTEDVFAMAYLSDGSHIGFFSWPEGSFGWRMIDRCGREAALAPGISSFIEMWERLLPESADAVRGLTTTDELHYSEDLLLSCPQWWTPGAALIGDAAHFFGPETGASAGIGIADAHALAQAIAAHPDDPDGACAVYTAWRTPAARQYEAMDPGRRRLLGATLPEGRPEERWPPPAR